MHHRLILGGQESGKSREAERRATRWLAGAPDREAVPVDTAVAFDDGMRARIARHRADRPADDWPAERAALLAALESARCPVVMVSNEIGCGVIPLGREVRRFVDEPGRLHQDIATRCADLTLMVAGQASRHPVRSVGREGSGEGAA